MPRTILRLIQVLKFNQAFGCTRIIMALPVRTHHQGRVITTNPHFLIVGIRRVVFAV